MSDSQSSVAKEDKPKLSIRLCIALILGGMLWIMPYVGSSGVLMPALFEQINPDTSVAMVAAMSASGCIVALIANILFGAFSDLTRSRWGARGPWLVVGSIGTCISLFVVSAVNNTIVILVVWCVFQFFLNAICAPLVAIIPDRAPTQLRGTYSAIYGVGTTVGSGLASIVASRFITDPRLGLRVFAIMLLLDGFLFVLIAPDKSNKDVPRDKFSMDIIKKNFAFPTKNCRDFYLALIGKLFWVTGFYVIQGYQLYIVEDYIGLETDAASDLIATMATIQTVFGLIFAAITGPLSDRVHRRKIFLVSLGILAAVVFLIPVFWPTAVSMILIAIFNSGIAQGAYQSVDQALNYDVLPNPETAAKDLGLLNMANTGGQVIGPLVTSAVVSASGSYQLSFVFATVFCVISVVMIQMIRKTK